MIQRVFDYTEITTKITSIFAFLMTIAYLFYTDRPINWGLSAIFFAGMFLFDLTTTAINNFIDSKTNDQVLPFTRSTGLVIILVLLATSAFLGLLLVYFTDVVVFLTGAFCFFIGVFYTFGPIPFSRQPWGEMLSGLLYGLFIPFLILYINTPPGTYLVLDLSFDTIGLEFSVAPWVALLFLSVYPVCTTANLMLINNICDLEKDILVKRYTLPYYVGDKAIDLFAWLYYIPYIITVVMVVSSLLPPISLLIFLTLWPVEKNIRKFRENQKKNVTFIVGVKNYIWIMSGITMTLFLGGLLS